MKTAAGKKVEQLLSRVSEDDAYFGEVVAALKVAIQYLDSLTDQGNVMAPEALDEIFKRLR